MDEMVEVKNVKRSHYKGLIIILSVVVFLFLILIMIIYFQSKRDVVENMLEINGEVIHIEINDDRYMIELLDHNTKYILNKSKCENLEKEIAVGDYIYLTVYKDSFVNQEKTTNIFGIMVGDVELLNVQRTLQETQDSNTGLLIVFSIVVGLALIGTIVSTICCRKHPKMIQESVKKILIKSFPNELLFNYVSKDDPLKVYNRQMLKKSLPMIAIIILMITGICIAGSLEQILLLFILTGLLVVTMAIWIIVMTSKKKRGEMVSLYVQNYINYLNSKNYIYINNKLKKKNPDIFELMKNNHLDLLTKLLFTFEDELLKFPDGSYINFETKKIFYYTEFKESEIKNVKAELFTRHTGTMWLYVVHFLCIEVELEEDELILISVVNNKLYQDLQHNNYIKVNFEEKLANLEEDILTTKIPKNGVVQVVVK